MKFWSYVLVVLLALGAGYAGSKLGTRGPTAAAEAESVYDRVMRTKTIRCGYAQWPPAMLVKDANTGKITGIFHEIAEEMAVNLNLKIEWAEETGWGAFIEGLQSNRFDMFCAPLWQNAERGRLISYSRPLSYSASHVYARAGDMRFDNDLSLLNAPEYKIATLDGEMSSIIARKFFPRAQTVSLPQLSDITQVMLDVVGGKADVTFMDPSIAKAFASKNPGMIRQATRIPYNIFPNVFGFRIGEEKFKGMIDSALGEMLNQGRIDKITEKYEPDRSIFMPVAKPYIYVEPAPLK